MHTFLICNAHLDPVWMWQWDEGVAEAISTFRAAAEFCEERDGFVFNHNESFLYRMIEQNAPELFLRIQKLVREGKWNIMGGWYIQPECNVPMGESIVRQILQGRLFFKEKFGKSTKIAVNFDSFGHSKGLVQVLNQAGYEFYLTCRPPKGHYDFADPDFWWEGYDGSKILVHRSDENYNSVKGQLKQELLEWTEQHTDKENTMFLWGVGNHGGGPSRKDLDGVEELQRQGLSLSHSTPEEYLAAIKQSGKQFPVVTEGLNPVAEGCYTSQIRIKQLHTKLENELYMTEKMASHAEMLGLAAYDSEAFGQALEDLMFCEFHDALPGSGNPSVEEDTIRQLQHGLEICAKLKTRYFFALSAGQEKVRETEVPLLIYNPHPFPVKTVIDCEFVLPAQRWEKNFSVPYVMRDGEEIPSQYAKEESHFNMDWRKRAVFDACLEPFSMNRYNVGFRVEPKRPEPQPHEQDGRIVVEAKGMTVCVNKETGLVDRYCVDGAEYLRPGALQPQVFYDECGAWEGHFDHARAPEAGFVPMTAEEATEFSGTKSGRIDAVRVIEDGPVRVVVEALLKYHHSVICQRYNILKNSRSIEVETVVFWRELEKRLKLSIPTALTDGSHIGQTIFGREKLNTREGEVVSQRWSGIFGKEQALTVINGGAPGSDFTNGELRVTLLRSAGYSAGTDGVLGGSYQEKMWLPRMDMGKREFRVLISAGAAKERSDSIEREAAAYHQKPYTLPYCPDGKGEKPEALLLIDKPNVVLSCVKKGERESFAYIVRVYESQGKKTEFEMSVPVYSIRKTACLEPFEIKTFKLTQRGLTQCSMLEDLCD